MKQDLIRKLSDKEDIKKVVIACMMADSYTEVNNNSGKARLDIYHSDKQLEYIKVKKILLEKLDDVKCNLYEKKDNRILVSGGTRIGYRLQTTYSNFFYMLHMMPEDKILENIINPISLAVLWMDDGALSYKSSYFSYAVLCSESWPIDFTKKFSGLLNNNYDIKCELMNVNLSSGIGQRVRFIKNEFDKFKNIIADYIIHELDYKINPVSKIDNFNTISSMYNFDSINDEVLIY